MSDTKGARACNTAHDVFIKLRRQLSFSISKEFEEALHTLPGTEGVGECVDGAKCPDEQLCMFDCCDLGILRRSGEEFFNERELLQLLNRLKCIWEARAG